jgi:hypothetical protein
VEDDPAGDYSAEMYNDGLTVQASLLLDPKRDLAPQATAHSPQERRCVCVFYLCPSLEAEKENRRPAATMGSGEGKSRKRRSSASSGTRFLVAPVDRPRPLFPRLC